jgi:hypothetical protein
MNDRNTDVGVGQGGAGGSRSYLCDELGAFFEDFTETFEGRRVAVMQQGQDTQWRVIADEQPLQALSYQVDDDSFDVRVVLGRDAGETFAHVVPDVRRIDFEPQGNGAAEQVRLQSSSGLTDLRFR